MSSDEREQIRLKKPAPSLAQKKYLQKGMSNMSGKLPLFDPDGQRYCERTVEACVRAGWARPAYRNNALKGMAIMRITREGRRTVGCIDDDNVIPIDWNRVVRSNLPV